MYSVTDCVLSTTYLTSMCNSPESLIGSQRLQNRLSQSRSFDLVDFLTG